ncbi:MAG: hypothetical protein ACWA5R_11035 [bacterium]
MTASLNADDEFQSEAFRAGGQTHKIKRWNIDPPKDQPLWLKLAEMGQLTFSRSSDVHSDDRISFLQITLTISLRGDSTSIIKELPELLVKLDHACTILQKSIKDSHFDPLPSLFVYLESTEIPQQPEFYLEAQQRSWLKLLSRTVLLSDDPLSTQISGAFVEGNLLMLRSNPDEIKQRDYPRHLLLPTLNPLESAEELEQDLLFVLNSWAEQEYHHAYRYADDPFHHEAISASFYLHYLDQALQHIQQQMLRIRGLASQKKNMQRAGHQTASLLALLHRLQHELKLKTYYAEQLADDLEHRLDHTDDTFHHLFALRPIPPLQNMDRALENLPGTQKIRDHIQNIRKQASRIRFSFEAYTQSLSAVMDGILRQENIHHSKIQRWLGMALAALAIVSAVPLIVGETAPADLDSLFAPILNQTILTFIQDSRPWIALTALFGSLLLISSTTGILLSAFRRKPHQTELAVSLAGSILAQQNAVIQHKESVKNADLILAKSLINSIQKLDQLKMSDNVRFARLLMQIELGCRRSIPMNWPISASIIRYALTPDMPGQWMTDEEYCQVITDPSTRLQVSKIFKENSDIETIVKQLEEVHNL